MFKAFHYIDRVVKSRNSRKGPILLHTGATCSELPSYIRTLNPSLHRKRYRERKTEGLGEKKMPKKREKETEKKSER